VTTIHGVVSWEIILHFLRIFPEAQLQRTIQVKRLVVQHVRSPQTTDGPLPLRFSSFTFVFSQKTSRFPIGADLHQTQTVWVWCMSGLKHFQ
jgi:hypothetical protein